jgi:flagellar operon protein
MVDRINANHHQQLMVKPPKQAPAGKADFASVLAAKMADAGAPAQAGNVKFSAHAAERLESRRIELGAGGRARLEEGVDRAAAKGARDALVLLGNLGFIVNVGSRTVITAMDTSELGGRVFTNIDSTVVLPGK